MRAREGLACEKAGLTSSTLSIAEPSRRDGAAGNRQSQTGAGLSWVARANGHYWYIPGRHAVATGLPIIALDVLFWRRRRRISHSQRTASVRPLHTATTMENSLQNLQQNLCACATNASKYTAEHTKLMILRVIEVARFHTLGSW